MLSCSELQGLLTTGQVGFAAVRQSMRLIRIRASLTGFQIRIAVLFQVSAGLRTRGGRHTYADGQYGSGKDLGQHDRSPLS